MAKFASGMIYAAMAALYEKEKATLNLVFEEPELTRRTVLGNFIILLFNYLPKVKDFIAH
jgi:hypothetical protein